MKTSDPDVKMIAAEVPIVFSKACEGRSACALPRALDPLQRSLPS
jgi:hypothetical protein